MEVYVTNKGEIFKFHSEALEQEKKDDIEKLLHDTIGSKYYFMSNEYELLTNLIYDNFEKFKGIIG